MSLRLLPKSEIDRRKAQERQREVEEGLKLARRVDNLREIAAQEEASLETFRRETIATIHEQITQEAEKLSALKREIRLLEKKRIELQKPLDEEWEKVAQAKADVAVRERELNSREQSLADEREKMASDRAAAKRLLDRITQRNVLSDARLHDAERARREADALLKSARRTEEAARTLQAEIEGELAHRDMAVAAREREVTMREAAAKRTRVKQAKEWHRLNDRKAAFERTIKRSQR